MQIQSSVLFQAQSPLCNRPSGSRPTLPPTADVFFGSSRVEVDYYGLREQDALLAKRALGLRPRRPKRWLQTIGLPLNRTALKSSGLAPSMSSEDVARLAQLKQDGAVIIANHSDNMDGQALIELTARTGKYVSGYLIAADALVKQGKVKETFMLNSGAIPVARGANNTHVVDWTSNLVADGQWAMLFPEGTVYWSREVKEMENGAVKIALEAALKAQESAQKKSQDTSRPVWVVPMAMVYTHSDQAALKAKVVEKLAWLEEQLGVAKGDQIQRSEETLEHLRLVAQKLLEKRVDQYALAEQLPVGFEQLSIYDQGKSFMQLLLSELEKEHLTPEELNQVNTADSEIKRRAFKVRAKIQQKKAALRESEGAGAEQHKAQEALNLELMKMEDIITLVSFKPSYREQFNDFETACEFIRRFSYALLGKDVGAFGKRDVRVKMLEPVDIRGYVEAYARVRHNDAQARVFLKAITDGLQQQIQGGVDSISAGLSLEPMVNV